MLSSEYIKTHELDLRKKIVDEAMKWQGAKYHINGMLPYTHCDCHTILIMVYSAVGIIDPIKPKYYNPQFMLNSGNTEYFDTIKTYANPVSKPKPGDLLLYRYGRVISHTAIVLDYPKIIHAVYDIGVILDDASQPSLKRHEKYVYSIWSNY